MRYIALLGGRAGAYGVIMPDLPGCSSGSATIDEAAANAQKALALWADEMASRGGKVPASRPVEAVLADPEVAAAIAAGSAIILVPLIQEAGRATRINISLHRGLLGAIDEAAEARKFTRSAFSRYRRGENHQRGIRRRRRVICSVLKTFCREVFL